MPNTITSLTSNPDLVEEEGSRKERRLSKEELDLIEDFVKSRGTISLRRQMKYRYTLAKMGRKLPRPLKEVTKDELRQYLEKGLDGYKDSVKVDYRHLAKIFYRKIRGEKFVSFIKVGNPKPPVVRDQLLTQDELSRLKEVCENIRDSAIIETLYETAARPQEFLSLRRSSIIFDERGALVSLQQSKTVVRPIRVVNAEPLLANWVANHPLKDRDAPLWVDLSSNTRYEPLKQIGLNRILKRVSRKAHIEKRIWAYVFRHTRITDLIRAGMNDMTLRKFAGWTPRSTAPSHYAHLVSEDVDAAILSLHGISDTRPAIELKVPKRCVRCGVLCTANQELCQKCGMALTLEKAMEQDEASAMDRKTLDVLRQMLPALAGLITGIQARPTPLPKEQLEELQKLGLVDSIAEAKSKSS